VGKTKRFKQQIHFWESPDQYRPHSAINLGLKVNNGEHAGFPAKK
jgi:hypothetical protein